LQITRDHSFVEDLVAAGEITHEEARHHPRRHIVTRVLGIEPDVVVDTWEVTPFAGDRYLLCSDGLTGEIDDEEIASVLRTVSDPQACADELLERALVSGARDNVTVLVVDVMADDPLVVSHLEPELGGWLTNGDHPAPVPFAPPAGAATDAGDLTSTNVASAVGTAAASGSVGEVDPTVGNWLGDEQAFTSDDGSDGPGQPVHVVVGDPDRPLRPRTSTWRTFAFVGLLAITAAVGFSAIALYARSGYTVTTVGDDVVVQKGRPGGLLWFDPTLEEKTSYTLIQFPEADRERIVSGRHFGSLEEARTYVARKVAEKVEQDSPSGPTTIAGTSTTIDVTATTLPGATPLGTTVPASATIVAPAATPTTVAPATAPTTAASVP
ncbi:MAG: SpoIIE family protein phosphatase, partial [Acidimicrobiia bacterium]